MTIQYLFFFKGLFNVHNCENIENTMKSFLDELRAPYNVAEMRRQLHKMRKF